MGSQIMSSYTDTAGTFAYAGPFCIHAVVLFLVVTRLEDLQVTQASFGFQRAFAILGHHPAVKLAPLLFLQLLSCCWATHATRRRTCTPLE